MELNPSQKRAVEHRDTHLLIVAGPGTGKTQTLIYRIAQYIQRLNQNQKILAITFTNKASRAMRDRLGHLCPQEIPRHFASRDEGAVENSPPPQLSRIFIGTFHQFCLSLLQKYAPYAVLPKDFRVAEPEEIEDLVKLLWPDQTRTQRQKILEEIAALKTKMGNFSEALRLTHSATPTILSGSLSVSTPVIYNVLTAYNQFLRENHLLDFDDILLEAVRLFKNNQDVLNEIRLNYPFIFVDEYQDINEVQHALLNMLAGGGGGGVLLTAIGDPHQAIYGFRGSDARFFANFIEDFKGAFSLTLGDNYRSTANLLKASTQIIRPFLDSKVPELVAKIHKEGHLIIHETPTDKAEAEYVVHQIEKLVGGTSMFSRDSGRAREEDKGQYGFGDIAVLYRLNALNRPLKQAFERSGIPTQVSGENSSPIADQSYQLKIDKVSLLTLHASKGLEFPVVFIVGCEEKICPLDLENLVGDFQEERRLFYVGMTRAKERLYLVHAKKRFLFGQTTQNAPSIFLKDIGENLKEYDQTVFKIKRKPEETQLTLFDF